MNFHRLVDAEARKQNHPDVDHERAIRLFPTTRNTTWALQVRAPMELPRAREGKDYIIACAHLSIDDLVALRDAANAALAEAGR